MLIIILIAEFFVSKLPKNITQTENITGRLQGQIVSGTNTLTGSNDSLSGQNLTLYAEVPVNGEIETDSFKIKLSGITKVDYRDSLLKVDTSFNDQCEVTTKNKSRYNEIGICLFDGYLTGYYRREFKFDFTRPFFEVAGNNKGFSYRLGTGIKF